MSEFLESSVNLIHKDAQALVVSYNNLLSKLNTHYVGDQKIRTTTQRCLLQVESLLRALSEQKQVQETSAFYPHSVSIENIQNANGWRDFSISKEVRAWRRNLDTISYETIPDKNKKEVFDYFFRHDIHGHLDQGDTIHLSRGTNDPEFFSPPSVVHIAINTASDNNWFGYSDSLGHVETRQAIANLEQQRRIQSNINSKNTAVIMGGTAGLNAVLSLLARTNKNSQCVVMAPNYAPIIDDVEHHFKPLKINLDQDYRVDKEELLKAAKDPSTSVVLISVPHNPSGRNDYIDILPQLHEACSAHNAYLVIDEIIFDSSISPSFDPIRYPNLIIISSYSKTYNVPGLKLGHLMANEDFIDKFYRHASTTYGSPPSFLYFTATMLVEFEKAERQQSQPIIPDCMKEQVSNENLIFEDFLLWKRHADVLKRFQKYVVVNVLENQRNCSVEGIFGLDDPSPNCVIRMKDGGSSYKASLTLMATSNISVMPVECFSPPSTWARDLRITISVDPNVLSKALPELITQLDSLRAWENPVLWGGNKNVILNNYTSEDIKGLGKKLRRVDALKDIYNISSCKNPGFSLMNAMHSVNIELNTELSFEKIVQHLNRIPESTTVLRPSPSSQNAADKEKTAYLLFIADRLSDITLPKAKIKSLQDIFNVLIARKSIQEQPAAFVLSLSQYINETGLNLIME